jgi:hypothetical protein
MNAELHKFDKPTIKSTTSLERLGGGTTQRFYSAKAVLIECFESITAQSDTRKGTAEL